MIRCKLISPTNLMLEHPLLLAPHDEIEFFVLGRKEYKRQLREWVYYGALLGFLSAVGLVSLFASLAHIPR